MTAKIRSEKPVNLSEHPVISALQAQEPMLWFNPYLESAYFESLQEYPIADALLDEAELRLERFKPFFMAAFPETASMGGLIESPLKAVPKFRAKLAGLAPSLPESVWLKCDSHLPISGSIKARGGFYEVLKKAETLALNAGLIQLTDDYSIFADSEMKSFLSQYTIAVGSTGNLGLSIGILSAVLGFQVNVHMSSDAKAWKKQMLRDYGVTVFEYDDDYSAAVAAGRAKSDADPNSHFVDDEHSLDLFLGYTVAARRLQRQLAEAGIEVHADKPLYVYLPCGVGGGPGGVAYGIKRIFGDAAHCYFAEPIQSPCMLLGISTQTHEQLSVQDFGLTNHTLADGLAVGRASGLVSRLMTPLLDGLFTVKDKDLLSWLKLLYETEAIALEPSALAGVGGLLMLSNTPQYTNFLRESRQYEQFLSGTHVLWATGGSMVPEADFKAWLK